MKSHCCRNRQTAMVPHTLEKLTPSHSALHKGRAGPGPPPSPLQQTHTQQVSGGNHHAVEALQLSHCTENGTSTML